MDGGTLPPELASAKLSLPPTAAAAGCALCADGVGARMARQFALLERLGALTMVLAESVGKEAAKYPGSSGTDAFVQVGRALRQTVALEMRLDAEREARERRAAAPPRRAALRETGPDAGQDDAADDVTDDDGDEDHPTRRRAPALYDVVIGVARKNLLADLRERLDCRDAVDDLRGRPSGEVVGRICQMLGIEADLSCFTNQEMGRRTNLNDPRPPQPPAPLSDAAFEVVVAPSHRPAGLLRPAGRRASRLRADEAGARDADCGCGGHDPPCADQ